MLTLACNGSMPCKTFITKAGLHTSENIRHIFFIKQSTFFVIETKENDKNNFSFIFLEYEKEYLSISFHFLH